MYLLISALSKNLPHPDYFYHPIKFIHTGTLQTVQRVTFRKHSSSRHIRRNKPVL